MIEAHKADIGLAGLAYTAFAVTMARRRLLGDRLRTDFGDLAMLVGSASLAVSATSGVQ